MKRNINRQDTPKIAIALALLLALCGAGWMNMQKGAAQQEEDRAALQMKRESGQVITEGDELLTPEAADDAQNKRQDADPNFHS